MTDPMKNKSYFRGHAIYERDGVWYFADNDQPTADTWKDRPCGHCGKANTPEGHDACLGVLPGVMNACCGHGQVMDAYVQFPSGEILRGAAALEIAERLKSVCPHKETKAID